MLTQLNDVTVDKGSLEQYRRVRTFIAGGTIAVNTPVSLDVSASDQERCNTVVASSATNAPGFVGVALDAATAGKRVRVVVEGYVEDAVTDGGVSQHDSLYPAAAVFDTFVPGTHDRAVGYALETDTSTACDVYLFKGMF